MTGAVASALFWPDSLIDREILAGGLALVPALLLAQHRQWPNVSVLLAAGLVMLCALHASTIYFGSLFTGNFMILFVLTPYIAIALGAGWFGEVRRYKAELQAAHLQLIQTEKLDSLGRMAAGIAHEVKNPLMVILTGVKILSKRPGADEKTHVLLQDMTDAVMRADKIIGGLLSYSRDSGIDLVSADLNAVVESALHLVKHDVDRTRMSVNMSLDSSLPPLRLDEFKIQQVLVNLLRNAAEALREVPPDRRVIQIASRAISEDMIEISVEDEGPGLSDEVLSKLYTPFITTKGKGGLGVGLSICRRIIEAQGGTMTASNRPEHGARIAFTVPRLARDQPHEGEGK